MKRFISLELYYKQNIRRPGDETTKDWFKNIFYRIVKLSKFNMPTQER